jgi:hypothetical protein
VDHPAERRGDEDVAFEAHQVVRVDLLRTAVEVRDLAARAHVLGEPAGVDALVGADRAARVRGADHSCAESLHKPRGPGADVPETLHDEGGMTRIELDLGRRFTEHLDYTAAGGCLAPEGPLQSGNLSRSAATLNQCSTIS